MKEEIKRCLQDPGNISSFLSCFTVTIQYLIFVYATNDHSQKQRGILWHFDLTTDKWRLKSDYEGYKHKLKCGKISDDETFL